MFEKVPRPQATQEVWPGSDWYCPVSQGEHAVAAPDAMAVPGAQGSQKAEPVTAANVPGSHSSHCTAPLFSWAKPFAHATHCADPKNGTKLPGLHGVHSVEPATSVKVPKPQAVHGALPVALKVPGKQSWAWATVVVRSSAMIATRVRSRWRMVGFSWFAEGARTILHPHIVGKRAALTSYQAPCVAFDPHLLPQRRAARVQHVRRVVIASKGGAPQHRGWFHNLTAEPNVEIQVGRERIPVRARIAEGEERSRLWARADEVNQGQFDVYQSRTKRPIPVVVLERR